MKVMTIVGTRPEIIKLSRVINELDRYVEHILVHTGQNYDYGLNQVFFDELEIRNPDYFLDATGKTTAETIGNVIAKSDKLMEKIKPDAILLLGDTNSCLSAISAKRRKIPIFHMEAGNRCFDQRVPEETNRKIVDHISDVNLTYTEHARRYLLREGLRPETVIKTGSPMLEIMENYKQQIDNSDILESLDLTKSSYYLISTHREENIDIGDNFNDLLDTLNAISRNYNKPLIVSTHPRTRKRLEKVKSTEIDGQIRFLDPLGFFDYVALQKSAICVVSDSGTITEESSILNFPAVTIRQAHERPEGMDEGTLIMCGLKVEHVLNSIDMVVSQHAENKSGFRIVEDYNVNNVSKKILRIIMSYTEYINRIIWQRQ